MKDNERKTRDKHNEIRNSKSAIGNTPIGRLALHAKKLVFVNYGEDETIYIDAPMPGDFKTALDILALKNMGTK